MKFYKACLELVIPHELKEKYSIKMNGEEGCINPDLGDFKVEATLNLKGSENATLKEECFLGGPLDCIDCDEWFPTTTAP